MTQQLVQLERGSRDNLGALLLIGGVGLAFVLSRQKTEGEPSPEESLPEGSLPSGGKALVAGSLSPAILVDQAQNEILKMPGEIITIRSSFTAATKSLAGVGITWPYLVRIRFGHSTTGGWKTADQLGLLPAGAADIIKPYTVANGTYDWTTYIQNAPDDLRQVYDIHVTLFAAYSSVNGTPLATSAIPSTPVYNDIGTLNNWKNLGETKRDGAVLISSGKAMEAGTLSPAILVSQRRIGRMGI